MQSVKSESIQTRARTNSTTAVTAAAAAAAKTTTTTPALRGNCENDD